METVVNTVLQLLEPVLSQCTLISFDLEALAYARTQRQLPVGWVIPEWTPLNREHAAVLAPQYLFCNRKRLPPPAAIHRARHPHAGDQYHQHTAGRPEGKRGRA